MNARDKQEWDAVFNIVLASVLNNNKVTNLTWKEFVDGIASDTDKIIKHRNEYINNANT